MSEFDKIAEIVGRFTRVKEYGRFAVVPTFSYYPSNAMVRAYVEAAGEHFIVSDGGGAVDTLHGAGGYLVTYEKILKAMARRRNFNVTPEGWLTSPRVDAAGLTGAITATAELSRIAAEILMKNFRVTEAVDFRRAVDRTLEGRFHSAVVKKAHLAGASNKSHTFDYLINLSSDRLLIIDTVVPDSSSINAALVSHLDVKNTGRHDIKQAIVFDDRASWKSSDLALLRLAAPPIAYSSFREQIEALAA